MNLLQSLAGQILEVSLAMSLVIAILLLLRPILGKHYRSKTFYWIWLFAALRLAIPLNVPIFPAPIRINMPNAILGRSDGSETDKDIPEVMKPILPEDMADTFYSKQPEAIPIAEDGITISQLVPIIWVSGAGLFLMGNLIAYMLFRRKVRRWSQRYADGPGRELFQELKKETGVANISLARCCAVPSPLVTGFFRPVLLLSNDNYTDQELDAIFRHELNHVRRHDLWYKLLLLIVRSLHWFNPLVYLMARRGEADLEISCDEAVIKGKTESFRSQYGHAILSVAEKGLYSPVFLTTNFKGGKNTMRERLSVISGKNGQHPGILIVFFAALMVTLAAAGCSLDNTSEDTSLTEQDPVGVRTDVQDVLSGFGKFLYDAGGDSDLTSIYLSDIPSLFDPDDAYMAIQNYAIVDLDSDGTDEAVIFVCGAAGDAGGYIVLHSIDDHVYGCRTDFRMFENLKTDGTFTYSNAAGTKEGVAVISFEQNSLILKDVLAATGQQFTMDNFMIDGKEVTEAEYRAEMEKQDLKDSVEWNTFS